VPARENCAVVILEQDLKSKKNNKHALGFLKYAPNKEINHLHMHETSLQRGRVEGRPPIAGMGEQNPAFSELGFIKM